MRPLIKTLFGGASNIAGVALIVAVAAILTGSGHADWAVFATPVVGLAVIVLLAYR
jgi:p-aminobenzoyl-glutamate transporter AbgT